MQGESWRGGAWEGAERWGWWGWCGGLGWFGRWGGGGVHCNKGCWGRQRINREPGLWASYVAVYDILAAARVFVLVFQGR